MFGLQDQQKIIKCFTTIRKVFMELFYMGFLYVTCTQFDCT